MMVSSLANREKPLTAVWRSCFLLLLLLTPALSFNSGFLQQRRAAKAPFSQHVGISKIPRYAARQSVSKAPPPPEPGVVERMTGTVKEWGANAGKAVGGLGASAGKAVGGLNDKLPVPLATLALWLASWCGILLLQRAAMPAGRYLYCKWNDFKDGEAQDVDLFSLPEDDGSYDGTIAHEAATQVRTAAKMGIYLYSVYLVREVVSGFFEVDLFPRGLVVKVAKVVYTIFAATRIQTYKRVLLGKILGQDPEEKNWGKSGIFEVVATVVLWVLAVTTVADILEIPLNAKLTPLYAILGLGTTVVAFSSQGLANSMVAGLGLVTSDKFREGDMIQVGDNGITGVVDKVGWMETEIRGPDEVITKLPNSVFSKGELKNLSREENCRVVETLALSYSDMKKIPKLVKDIKAKLIEACPKLISDGSRPFIVSWSGFRDQHLEVLVDARFRISPVSEAYYENKQRVMETIAEAVLENDVTFAGAQRQEKSDTGKQDETIGLQHDDALA